MTFVLIAVISLSGFYESYFQFLPQFSRFPAVIHIHFSAFFCWFAMIIIQPLLIRQKNYTLHRKVGRLSYLLAPILVLTIIVLVRDKAQREWAVSTDNAAMTAFIGLLDILSFSAYYIIAMIKRNNTRWHVAFIIAASLVVLNPGMARLLNQIKPGLGLAGAVLAPFLVSAAIILFEKIKYKRQVLTSPYALFFLCWALEIALLMAIPQTTLWKKMVSTFIM